MTKKHFAWYLKGFPGASDWRVKFMHAKTTEEMGRLLSALMKEYGVSEEITQEPLLATP